MDQIQSETLKLNPVVDRPKVPPRQINTVVGIETLRRKYEDIADKCSQAIDAGDKPLVTKLMAEKRDVHIAWHKASRADMRAKRTNEDRLKRLDSLLK